MTDTLSAPSKHSEQPRYYRDWATAIRARLPTLQDDEVFTELYLLAAYYERLAEFAESSGSLLALASQRPQSRQPSFRTASSASAARLP
jgi:hypothetical protein